MDLSSSNLPSLLSKGGTAELDCLQLLPKEGYLFRFENNEVDETKKINLG
jgi:hypothetical protein